MRPQPLVEVLTPRGIRNRNPGNIRATTPDTWQGQIGTDPKGFAIFDQPRDGLRALGKVLLAYWYTHHLRSLRQLTERYAPPSDGNNPNAYATALLGTLMANPHTDPPCATDAYWDWTTPTHLPALMARGTPHCPGTWA